MAERSLDARVEILEQTVGDLEKLPARRDAAESQILQLRVDMRDGFSAIRQRLDNHDQRFDAIDRRFDETNRHMRVLHEEALRRVSLIKQG